MKVLLFLDKRIKVNKATILHRVSNVDYADFAYKISPSNLKKAVRLVLKKHSGVSQIITSGVCNTERIFRRTYADTIAMLEKKLNRQKNDEQNELAADNPENILKTEGTPYPILSKLGICWDKLKNCTYRRRKIVVFTSRYGFLCKADGVEYLALEHTDAEIVKSAEALFAQKLGEEASETVKEYDRAVNRFIHNHIPLKTDSKSEVVRKTVQNFAAVAFVVAAVVLLYNGVYKSVENTAIQSEIQSIYYDGETSSEAKKQDHTKNFKKLQSINKDIVAWISIDHTNIDYPVLYHKGDALNEQYYLYRDYNKNYSDYGSIFIDFRSQQGINSKNVIMHGHHMNDGSMFANLLKYGKTSIDLDFYKKSPTVAFSTPQNGTETYKIISVFKTPGYIKDDEFFNYMQGDFASEAEFMNYVYNVRVRSMVNCPVDVNEDDSLITLSTCSYEPYDGYRTVLVARKTRDGESTKVDVANAKKNTKAFYPDDFCYRYGIKQTKITSFKTEYKKGNIDWYDGDGQLDGSQKLTGGKFVRDELKKQSTTEKKKDKKKNTSTEETSSTELTSTTKESTTQAKETTTATATTTTTEPKAKVYTVKFYNANGKVIKNQKVKDGESAKAPKPPKKKANNRYTYTFVRWNKSFKKVHSNLKIRPVYKSKKIVVHTIKTTTVPKTKAATITKPTTVPVHTEPQTAEPYVTEPIYDEE